MTREEEKRNEAIGRLVTTYTPGAWGWAKRAFLPLLMGYAAGGGSGTVMANYHTKYVTPRQMDSTLVVRLAEHDTVVIQAVRSMLYPQTLAYEPPSQNHPQNNPWHHRHSDSHNPSLAGVGHNHGEH